MSHSENIVFSEITNENIFFTETKHCFLLMCFSPKEFSADKQLQFSKQTNKKNKQNFVLHMEREGHYSHD